jgi:hypothetical protein
MKPIQKMSQLELAAYVHAHLRQESIDVVLSGGALVTLYSHDRYISKDVDLINIKFSSRRNLKKAMEQIGFKQNGRHFVHPDSQFIIEFPDGPLSVGEEPVKEIQEIQFETGTLRVISPTDCVKDRLCAYYFWGDLQGLEQAVMVAEINQVDIGEIERWSKRENKLPEFEIFKKQFLERK